MTSAFSFSARAFLAFKVWGSIFEDSPFIIDLAAMADFGLALTFWPFSTSYIEFITSFHESWNYKTWFFFHKICHLFWFVQSGFSSKDQYSQGVSCDPFLGRTHAPRMSKFRCARTRVRTSNLRWSHFAPAPFVNQHFFQKIFSKFSTFYKVF